MSYYNTPTNRQATRPQISLPEPALPQQQPEPQATRLRSGRVAKRFIYSRMYQKEGR